MLSNIENFLKKYESILLILILALFIIVNAQGLSWGLPSRWNPDELVGVVNLALNGLEKFDSINFDYPSLPKYFMLFIGTVTDSLGYPRTIFFMVSRFFSVILGGMAVFLAYGLVRQAGGSCWSAILASLFVFTNSEITINSHFAHNDMYVTFFAGMSVYFIIHYLNSHKRGWLYVAFFTAGLTASSKYNGGGILLMVVVAYLLVEKKKVFKDWLQNFEVLFSGLGLCIIGYGIGTPTALAWPSFYIKRLLPTLWYQANYNRSPTSQIGLFTQWNIIQRILSNPVYFLFLFTFLVLVILTILFATDRIKVDRQYLKNIFVIVGSVFVLDIPILVSYNVQQRYFLPLIPLLCALVTLIINFIIVWLQENNIFKASYGILAGLVIIIALTSLRVASVDLSIKNDARIVAGQYIATLPAGTSLEYTLYSPNIDDNHFLTFHEYPLMFIKFPNQLLPKDGRFEYNSGEEGIEERKPDYLVISSFVYNRFEDDYVCELHKADCNFFKKLFLGTANYQKIADFKYQPPSFLPRLNIVFINPEIQVYERIN